MISINGESLPVTIFPDNTSQVWKLPPHLLSSPVTEVFWEYTHEGEFMQIAQLKALLDQTNTFTVLSIKYLPYARQDKAVDNELTFALQVFAKQLNSLEFNNVIILDPHSNEALELIDNSEAVFPMDEISKVIIDEKIGLVCYPDAGALRKYAELYDYPYIHGEKVREQSTGYITHYELKGDPKGKNVLIVDDICDGGMTFKILAKDLLASGANSVVLFVTHGIFSKGTRTLFDSGIAKVYTADGEVGKRSGSIQF